MYDLFASLKPSQYPSVPMSVDLLSGIVDAELRRSRPDLQRIAAASRRRGIRP